MTYNLSVWEGCGLFRFSFALMELMVKKESALLWDVRKISILVQLLLFFFPHRVQLCLIFVNLGEMLSFHLLI